MRILAVGFCTLLVSGCVVDFCHNGVRDGDETDVDCGGSHCGPCPVGDFCAINHDCVTNICAVGVCAAVVGASCTDGIQDGTETDVDCGGGTCPACGPNRKCAVGSDCATLVCSGGLCTPHPTGAGIAPITGDVFAVANGQGATTPTGGYGITASGVGSSVTMRITALGATSSQEFYGSIWSAGGLSNVSLGCAGACTAPVAQDFVSQPYSDSGGTRIDFDIIGANATGFDFDVGFNSSAQPVYFDVLVDGSSSPLSVNFFAANTGTEGSPTAIPFGLFSQ
jgi:hypothetical protein